MSRQLTIATKLATSLMILLTFLSTSIAPGRASPLTSLDPGSYTIGWVNTYKFPAVQPVCTGVGIVSQYYGGEECGFGVFSISPAEAGKSIEIRFKDENGVVFHTEPAIDDSTTAGDYQVDIVPDTTWPVGAITLEAVMQSPDTGSASTGIFLNWLHQVGGLDKNAYAPGDPVIVTGNVYKRTGTNIAPTDTPVAAGLTVQIIDPDTLAVLATQTTTASALDGSWSVTFPGGDTAAFTQKNYRVKAAATWTDPTAAFGPADWKGELNLIAPFLTGAGDLLFTAQQTATNGTVHAGETFLTALSAQNPTLSGATSVQAQAVLPAGAIFVESIPSPDGGAGTLADPLTWTLGAIPADGQARIYLYARAKTGVEDNTIVWQLLDIQTSLTYLHNAQLKTASDTTLGPKVVPVGDVGDTVRHGQRPFPVALVDYSDLKHDASHTGDYFHNQIFAHVIERYQEMSFGQLLPVPILPSVGQGDVRYDETPSETYSWSTLQINGFCSGVTTAGESGNPTDTDGPPLGATYRIQGDWFQLPGTQGYYGSDSTGSAYAGALSGQGTLMNVDNGCNPPGAIAYDAATLMDPNVDFNQFDSDRDGWVDFFELVYQGQPENILGESGVNNVWPHSSDLAYYYPGGYVSHDQLRDHQDRLLYWTDATQTVMTTTVTGFIVYVKVGPYNVNAEFSDETTFSHEYGHSLGLPDNYSLGSRVTMGEWDLMSSGAGHMSIWDKQELGWIVPFRLTSDTDVTSQTEVKVDNQTIEWRDSAGIPYTLSGNVHNGDVYKVDLPKVTLFDPAIIPSGSWVYYSQAGNDFGYPGHVFDISFDANLTTGASSLQLNFQSWYEIEKDYDYGYLQVSTDGGSNWTNLPSEAGTTTTTDPNGNNHGNGITCVSGAQDDPTCGVLSYPEPAFITDTFDLTAYAGQDFIVRWDYSTDPGLAMRGWVIDDIVLVADGNVVFDDDAEDPIQSHDGAHVYNGWVRSNGTATAEHAYWIGVRDRTGFDVNTAIQPGVVMEFANEAHGYGNFGVDNPPALTVLDSHPEPANDAPNLNDASWRPFPTDPGNPLAENGDYFTDCGDPTYANAPRHVENYSDPSRADSQWLFDHKALEMLVNSLAGEGSGAMSADVTYRISSACQTPQPTLEITKQDSPDPVKAGELLTYTISVVNTGNAQATGVVVSDTLPLNTTFESCSGACTLNGTAVTWNVGSLTSGGSLDLTLVVTVDGSLANGSVIRNLDYSVDSDQTNPLAGEPVNTQVTTSDLPQLEITKRVSSDMVQGGDPLTYTLTVRNTGNVAATVVVVDDALPAGTTYVSCGGATCVLNSGVVTWTVGTLASGASLEMSLVVQVNDTLPAESLIVNDTYSADSLETNPVFGAPVVTRVNFVIYIYLPLISRNGLPQLEIIYLPLISR